MLRLSVAAGLAAVLVPLVAYAEDAGVGDPDTVQLEEMVVLGTRVRGVSYEELAVPVDVYETEEIAATGTIDLGVALQKAAPSFNSKRNALGDGGLFHTAALRGMSPDHTLLLINGKRRHGISFPRPLDQTGQGTTGADLRAIPMAAIERIEVLRDGAASQYGSDAIGGVINVVLKENPDESTVSFYTGVTQEGDGERYSASANAGIPVGPIGGALNITVEMTNQGQIDRAYDTGHLDPGGPNPPSIARKIVLGEPEHDNQSMFVNLTAPAGTAGDIYAFGGWSLRSGLSSGAWRDPSWSPDRIVGPVHPDGFLPFETSDSEDRALTMGYRSVIADWDYDVSVGYGSNTFDFGATDSINASWAAGWLEGQLRQGRSLTDITRDEVIANAGPRSGDSGGLKLRALSIDLDLAGEISMGNNVIDAALGAQFRNESFRMRAGDFASYGCGTPDNPGEFPAVTLEPDGTVGQLANEDGVPTLARCGHQGYPGYWPVNAEFGTVDRASKAAWADFRHDVSEGWGVEVALRFEDHEGAGGSVTGMLGSRYDLTPEASLRAVASTGFRAPSLPQRGFNSIGFQGGNAEGGLSVTANLEEGAAHEFLDVGPARLGHESSRNFSAGLVWSPGASLSMSADVYHIEVSDRIVLLSQGCGSDPGQIPEGKCAALATSRGLPRLTNVQYFDNAADTRTTGLDVVARHEQGFAGGRLALTGALHFNRTEITASSANLQSHARSYIESGNPRQQHRMSAKWTSGGSLDLHFGLNYYGKAAPQWFLALPHCPGEISEAWIAGVETGWRFNNLRLAIGADNLFDEYPDPISEDCSLNAFGPGFGVNNFLGWGIRHSPDTSYGLSGRLLYLRVDATF